MDKPTVHSVERKIGDPVLRFETGRLATLADGSVLAQLGETTVLLAATASKSAREGVDFFPLTVDLEERMYAAGKIPGGFFRREGKASEKAILTSRLIDRPLRPCFPDGFRNEVHIVGIVKSVDLVNPGDVLAVNAASAALMLSGIPFEGPVGCVRLAHIDGQWVANPSYQQLEEATFEITVAGRRGPSGEADVLMVEAGATDNAFQLVAEGAPEVTEEVVAGGLDTARQYIIEAIELQEELVAAAGVKEQDKTFIIEPEVDPSIVERVKGLADPALAEAVQIAEKAARETALSETEAKILEVTASEFEEKTAEVSAAFKKLTKLAIRRRVAEQGIRIDGRGVNEVRPIWCEVGVLPRVHGSGLFNRGQTQVLSALTLGMLKME
ncbi:MAG: polyribonucleotide nucleotidyltransferase, partial [Actinomycetota bacterium]